MRAAVLLASVLGLIGCGNPGNQKVDPVPQSSDPVVEADDLFGEYKADAVAAAAKHAGKPIRLRLRVDGTQQIGDKVILIHRLRPGGGDRVQARVPVTDLGAIKSGEPVVVAGKVFYQDAVEVSVEGRVAP